MVQTPIKEFFFKKETLGKENIQNQEWKEAGKIILQSAQEATGKYFKIECVGCGKGLTKFGNYYYCNFCNLSHKIVNNILYFRSIRQQLK